MGLQKNIPVVLAYGKNNQTFCSPLTVIVLWMSQRILSLCSRGLERLQSLWLACIPLFCSENKSLGLFLKKAKLLGALLLTQNLTAIHLLSLTNWPGLFWICSSHSCVLSSLTTCSDKNNNCTWRTKEPQNTWEKWILMSITAIHWHWVNKTARLGGH